MILGHKMLNALFTSLAAAFLAKSKECVLLTLSIIRWFSGASSLHEESTKKTVNIPFEILGSFTI